MSHGYYILWMLSFRRNEQLAEPGETEKLKRTPAGPTSEENII